MKRHCLQTWVTLRVVQVAVFLSAVVTPGVWGAETQTLSLEQCLGIALENNHRRPASRFAVAAAEAQHRQALSGYWPQVGLKAAYEQMDEPPNFLFPSTSFGIPAQHLGVPAMGIQTPAMMYTIPAGSFAPGFPRRDLQVPVAPQTVNVPAQSFSFPAQDFPVPAQDIKVADEESWIASLQAQWLLWDGGWRRGMREQASAGLDAAREELRRTDLEIIDGVKRLYHGSVLARQVRQVGEDTLARMEATLSMTETMYKEGSGTVKKTDFLSNKVMVETLRSAVALLEKNESMGQAALAFTMGMAWNDSVRPADNEIPFEPSGADLEALVSDAYSFNPDWKRLEAGIRAAEGAVREARSEHYPKLALTGELHRWWNDFDSGLATDENKEGWVVGVGLELPLFKGFLTRNKVKQLSAKLGQIREQRILLREGIGLQLRDIVLGLDAAEKRFEATRDAMTSATENRDLNTRAYQNDLVETGDVIRAQLMEAFMSAQHYKMRFDHAELISKLNLIVGTEVNRQLTEAE